MTDGMIIVCCEYLYEAYILNGVLMWDMNPTEYSKLKDALAQKEFERRETKNPPRREG